jgi:hypothetical protein
MGVCKKCGSWNGKDKCLYCGKEKAIVVVVKGGYGSLFDEVVCGGFQFCSDECMKKYINIKLKEVSK